MFLNFISLMTKCFSLLNVTVKTDVKRKLKKNERKQSVVSNFHPTHQPSCTYSPFKRNEIFK